MTQSRAARLIINDTNRREPALQGGSVLGEWWVIAWVRQYSASIVVGARKRKALIFYTINPLLYDKRSLCVFEPLFGGFGATYTVQLRLIGKSVVDFLLVIIELSFTRCYGSGATSEYRLEVAIFEGGGLLCPKILGGRGHLSPTICARLDRPVHTERNGHTDGRTDRQNDR